jgi:peptidoglycan-associated lipoprotein
MSGWWKRGLVLALVLMVPLAGGCKKKGPKAGGADGAGAGFGEEGLGNSSLERARRGLAPEEGGILGDVRFGYDSTDIEPDALDVLGRNVDWLKDNRNAKVELEGHADSRGTIEYNLALGAKRAKSVKDHLVGQGISADRISTISYGEELPLCQEETDPCWARNRRVHFVILGQ